MLNVFRVSFVLALVLALASCASDKHLQQCPSAAVLVEASSMTVFPPGAQELPQNQLYRIDATGVKTDCDVDKPSRKAVSSLQITFRAARTSGQGAVTYNVPYFVAVTDGTHILTKRVLSAPLVFASGQQTAQFSQSLNAIDVRAARNKHAYDYEILTGLQLTKAQLAFNRKYSRYAQ